MKKSLVLMLLMCALVWGCATNPASVSTSTPGPPATRGGASAEAGCPAIGWLEDFTAWTEHVRKKYPWVASIVGAGLTAGAFVSLK